MACMLTKKGMVKKWREWSGDRNTNFYVKIKGKKKEGKPYIISYSLTRQVNEEDHKTTIYSCFVFYLKHMHNTKQSLYNKLFNVYIWREKDSYSVKVRQCL